MSESFLLKKTKLFPPDRTNDFVERKSIQVKFDQLSDKPLMLISAPTGHGKSTLVAEFTSQKSINSAWYSLDESDNELGVFLAYFINSIQRLYPGFAEDILELTQVLEMPSETELANLMVNELVNLPAKTLLILDDYHMITNAQIHTFISRLFDLSLPGFRLIIISRVDPDLPLSVWRSKNKLIEIRSDELRFDNVEIQRFCSKSLGLEVDEIVLEKLQEITDGWISGLRMLTLLNSDESTFKKYIGSLQYLDSHILKQLINDILKNQSEPVRNQLLEIALVDEFNADLFAAMCLPDEFNEDIGSAFDAFINTIIRSNLFIIQLDDKYNWYRFHHLFTQLLRDALHTTYSADEVIELQKKAGDWYAINGQVEDAIRFYLQANLEDKAIKAFERLRFDLLSKARWQRLETVFGLFNEDIINRSCLLKLTQAWLLVYKGDILTMHKMLPAIEELLNEISKDDENWNNLNGELHSLGSYTVYNLTVDMPKTKQMTTEAIQQLDPENLYPLGIAWIFYGGSMQALGSSAKAKQVIKEEITTTQNAYLKANLFLILCYISWMDGDMHEVHRNAAHLKTLGLQSLNKEAVANAHYFSGIAYYFLDMPEKALVELTDMEDLRHFTILVHRFFGSTALAFLHLEFNNLKRLEAILREMDILAVERGGLHYIKLHEAISSAISWIRKKDPRALKWAMEKTDEPILPMTNFTSVELLQSFILVHDHNKGSWEKGMDVLSRTIEFLEKTNNTMFLVSALVLKCIAQSKLFDTKNARKTLERAVDLAAPINLIKPFETLASYDVKLLLELKQYSEYDGFVEHIVKLNRINEIDSQIQRMLTAREIQILELIQQNMTNKEIGSKLFISEKTVKRHIANLYKKINASSRREAVLIAKELDIT